MHIKSGSHTGYFFEYKKTENNFKQSMFPRGSIQIEREAQSRMRKKKMIKHAVSIVNVQ